MLVVKPIIQLSQDRANGRGYTDDSESYSFDQKGMNVRDKKGVKDHWDIPLFRIYGEKDASFHYLQRYSYREDYLRRITFCIGVFLILPCNALKVLIISSYTVIVHLMPPPPTFFWSEISDCLLNFSVLPLKYEIFRI